MRRHRNAITSVAALLLCTITPMQSGHAQTCLRARPLPACRSFALLELGYAHRLGAPRTATGASLQVHYLNGEVGWMFSRSPRLSVGGAFFAGALVDYDFELRPGLKARARRWLGDRTALDLGAGVMVGRVPVDTAVFTMTERRPGATAHLGLSLDDVVHLTVMAEYLPNPVDRDLVGYLGARLGSKPALRSGLIVGALLGLGAAAMSN